MSQNGSEAAETGAGSADGAGEDRSVPAAAERALAEAAARRAKRANGASDPPPTEHGGRGGLDPVRFADWEIGGRAVDF